MVMQHTVGIHRLEEGPAGRIEAAGRTEIVRTEAVVHNLAAGHNPAGSGHIDRRRSPVEAAAGILGFHSLLAAGCYSLGRSWSPGRNPGPEEGIHPGCIRILT